MSSILSKLINLAGNITGTLAVANGGTGVTASTGTGSNVLSNSPTLVTPILGTPTSGTLSGCTGYPVVVPGTSAGLISSSGVTGYTGASAIGAGFVGEVQYSTADFNRAMSSSAYVVSTNITLTAGVWLLTGMVFAATVSVNTAQIFFSISQNSGAYSDIVQNNFFQGSAVTLANGGSATIVAVASLSGTSAARTVAVRCQASGTVTGAFSSLLTCVRIA